MRTGLYIHVPFCRARCHFCAFYLQIYQADRAHAYVESLLREIRLHAEQHTLQGVALDSVYFGGGTPTMLQPDQLAQIVQWISDHFGIRPHAEITVEAHPETVTAESLAALRQAGFNRVSFGVQSMSVEELAQAGRPTSPDAGRTAAYGARAAGFENINLDLIYGLPGQTPESWRRTLDETLELDPAHVSCYALTVEDGTRLQRDLLTGRQAEPDVALQLAMEQAAERHLAAAGFQHYEISNFCRPGYACRHNLLYWTGGEYLGLGPSAQSYLNGCRFGNVEDLDLYRRMLDAGRLPIVRRERLSPAQRSREAVVFGLRLIEGVTLIATEHYPLAIDGRWAQEFERLIDHGLISRSEDRIMLTETGRRYADSVAVALL